MSTEAAGSLENIGVPASIDALPSELRHAQGPRPPAQIRLLATDLDGTLIGSANELPLYLTFNDRVDTLRKQFGAHWVACTGRTFRSFWEFFMPMRKYGVIPDYVIISHAFIFRLTRLGYLPHLAWNTATMLRIWKETRQTMSAIQDWHTTVVGGAIGVRTIVRRSDRIALRFDSPEAAQVAQDMLLLRQVEHRHMQIMRNKTEVEVRLVPATKGTAVAELANRLGVSRGEILAIGNGHNDLSMLDGSVADLVGCPANSVFDVMTMVKSCNGHVAEQRSLSGVLEIVDAFSSGNVSSELPSEMPPSEHRIKSSGKRDHKNRRGGFRKSYFLVIAGIVYGTLLAFSTFDVLPYSHVIRKPMELLIHYAVKLLWFL